MEGFIFIAVIIMFGLIYNNTKLRDTKIKNENKIIELQETITKLKDKDFVEKEKRVMELQAQSIVKTMKNITQYESIKVARVSLGNMARAFKSSFIWLQLKDMTTLEMTDGCTTVTLKCNYEARKTLRK